MAFTFTPCFAHSMASDFVSDATAALLAEYAATSNSETNVESEAILTIRPYPFEIICRRKLDKSARFRSDWSRVLRSSPLLEGRSSVLFSVRPAEFTRMSTFPNAETHSESKVSTDEPTSETSEVCSEGPLPRASISSPPLRPVPAWRDVHTTSAPASATHGRWPADARCAADNHCGAAGKVKFREAHNAGQRFASRSLSVKRYYHFVDVV